MLQSHRQVKQADTDGAASSQLTAITSDPPLEKDRPWCLLETPPCSCWVREPRPSQLALGGTRLFPLHGGRAAQGTGLGPGSTFQDQEAEAGARKRLGQGWDWGDSPLRTRERRCGRLQGSRARAASSS